jgi:hypothetical protein
MRLLACLLLVPGVLCAVQHSGSVRAADQFIPGASVTARQGGAKVVAYTDESGRYSMELTPGTWELEVDLFGFRPKTQRLEVTNESTVIEWTLEMPRRGEPEIVPTKATTSSSEPAKPTPAPAPKQETAAPATQPTTQNATGRRGQFQGRGQYSGRGGRGPQQAQAGAGRGGRGPGFQNVTVQATEQGRQQSEAAPPAEDTGDDGGELTIRGSDSGGLADAADEQARRNRMAGRGGPGGPGGRGGTGSLAEMAALGAGAQVGGDTLGLNGFGAAGVQNGFGDGMGGATMGGPGFGGPGGGGGRGGAGGPGGGGGRGGGAGGRGVQVGGRGGRGGRGPNNGAFTTFGNRRRDRPQYTGSVALTARNSVLDARPFSLNGQTAAKPSYAQNNISAQFGGPLRIPKVGGWDRSMIFFSWSGNRARNPFNQVSTMPSALERAGDFSQTLISGNPVTVYDPLTSAPFPGNIVPVNRFNPASVGLLNFLPLPTYTQLAVQNYQFVSNSKSRSDNYSVRDNMPFTRKDRVNISFNYQTRNGTSAATSPTWSPTSLTRPTSLPSSASWALRRSPSRTVPRVSPSLTSADSATARLRSAATRPPTSPRTSRSSSNVNTTSRSAWGIDACNRTRSTTPIHAAASASAD